MNKILFIIATVVVCFTNSANCDENDTHLPSQILKAYTIQVSSHKMAVVAEKEMNRLIAQGLDAFVDSDQVKDQGMWHRVCVGRFKSWKAATSFANELADTGVITDFWVKPKNFYLEIKKQEVEITGPEKEETTTLDVVPPPPPPEVEKAIPKSDMIISEDIDTQVQDEESVADIVEKKNLPPDVQSTPIDGQKDNRFSMGLITSFWYARNASDFIISDSGNLETWAFGNNYLLGGIVAGLQLTENWALESSLEIDLVTELDIWELSMGAKYQFEQMDVFVPFIRGSILYGHFEWSEAPGEFDRSIGLDGGLGFSITKSSLQLGFEASYRQMKYKYNPPSVNGYAANEDYIDVSGIVLSCTLQYLF